MGVLAKEILNLLFNVIAIFFEQKLKIGLTAREMFTNEEKLNIRDVCS